MPDPDIEAEHFPWYRLVEGPGLRQGDVLRAFPVVVAEGTLDDVLSDKGPLASVAIADVIILSQSCDLANDKTGNVIVAPIYEVEAFIVDVLGITKTSDRESTKKNMKAGRVVSVYGLPPCDLDGLHVPCRIVHFRDVAVMPLVIVREHAIRGTQRERLQSPYREDMAQCFGRFVMRIGHPRQFTIP